MENDVLDSRLAQLSEDMKTLAEEAVKEAFVSGGATVSHMKAMEKVLEADLSTRDEAAWNEVFEAATNKSRSIR